MISRVISKDGTSIATFTSGEGSPLVLIHGVLAEHGRWGLMAPALAQSHRVVAMDRRWRGGSDDGPNYAMEREAEDVIAVVGALDGPVDILAHSFGAIATLAALKQLTNVRSLVLYEPILNRGPIDTTREPAVDAVEAQALAGDREGALRTFYREHFHMPEAGIDAIKAAGYWDERLAVIHATPREVYAARTYLFDPASYADIDVPVLLVLGTESPPIFAESIALAREAFPKSTTVMLEGQGHHAMATAPQLLVDVARTFFAGLDAANRPDDLPAA